MRWIAVIVLAVSLLGIFCWSFAGTSAAQLLQKGNAALSKNDVPLAVACAEQVVVKAPRLAAGWKLLAEAAGRQGEWDRACDALEEYARLKPQEAGQHALRLGRDWMGEHRILPALRALRLSEKLSAEVEESLLCQELIAGVTGHSRETTRCIMERIKRESFGQDEVVLLAAVEPILNDVARLKEILLVDPENKYAMLGQAIQEIQSNHYDKAEQLLLEITKADPEDFEAQATLAKLYALYFPEKFYQWHAELPAHLGDDALIWSARGSWLSHFGQTEAAIRCLHEALLREPEQLTATTLLGQLLYSQHETELGQAFTERSRQLHRIIELQGLFHSPRAGDYVVPMIKELEAAGRLWEAWAFCVVYSKPGNRDFAEIVDYKNRIEPNLHADLPRTKPGSLPGGNFDWDRYPLPDWPQLNSFGRLSPQIAGLSPFAIRFEDRAETVGLDFRYAYSYSPSSGGRRIFEATGNGVAVLDYDGDGWPDLYIPQGNKSPADETQDPSAPSDRLYRNDRGERYLDVTPFAGIHETSYSNGAAAGDIDNDGFPDIYVGNLGRNRLYRNNGDGTYTDATEAAGLSQSQWTQSCAIADLNGDGLPELFDVNYIQDKRMFRHVCTDSNTGRSGPCRPQMFDPSLDTVLINLGDGRFLEQQAECGLDLPQGYGLGLVIADFNDDSRPDVFIANDTTANYLLINDQAETGSGLHFQEEAYVRGLALDQNGSSQACMGIACADLNRDGFPDLLVTNFTKESNALYLSQPGGFYQDRTQAAGLREPSFNPLGFGTQFFDADNDGWHDLAVVNGHIDIFPEQPFQMKPQFFQGLPDGRFQELSAAQAGAFLDQPRLGRGMAILDWNRDGRVDFLATDLDDAVLLAENQTESPGRSLRLRLIGTQSSRDAVGAKVRITVTPGEERFAQLTAGDGYSSSNEHRICVGLGSIDRADHVEIQWPSGQVSRAENVRLDTDWLVIEGQSEWRTCP